MKAYITQIEILSLEKLDALEVLSGIEELKSKTIKNIRVNNYGSNLTPTDGSTVIEHADLNRLLTTIEQVKIDTLGKQDYGLAAELRLLEKLIKDSIKIKEK